MYLLWPWYTQVQSEGQIRAPSVGVSGRSRHIHSMCNTQACLLLAVVSKKPQTLTLCCCKFKQGVPELTCRSSSEVAQLLCGEAYAAHQHADYGYINQVRVLPSCNTAQLLCGKAYVRHASQDGNCCWGSTVLPHNVLHLHCSSEHCQLVC